MRLYRVSHYETSDGHRGYAFYRTRHEAELDAHVWLQERLPDDEGARASVECIEIARNTSGVLIALNQYASHPDNG